MLQYSFIYIYKYYNYESYICFLNRQPCFDNPSISIIILGSILSQLENHIFTIQKFFFGEIVIPVILSL